MHSGALIASFAHFDPTCIPQRVDFCINPGRRELIASLLYVFKNEINVVKLMNFEDNQDEVAPVVEKLNESFRIESGNNEKNSSLSSTTKFTRPSADELVLTVFPTLSLLESSPLSESVKNQDDKKPRILSMQDYIK